MTKEQHDQAKRELGFPDADMVLSRLVWRQCMDSVMLQEKIIEDALVSGAMMRDIGMVYDRRTPQRFRLK